MYIYNIDRQKFHQNKKQTKLKKIYNNQKQNGNEEHFVKYTTELNRVKRKQTKKEMFECKG